MTIFQMKFKLCRHLRSDHAIKCVLTDSRVFSVLIVLSCFIYSHPFHSADINIYSILYTSKIASKPKVTPNIYN